MRVFVSYPLVSNWTETELKILDIVAKNHGQDGDSGAGFGQRDHEFSFRKKKDAETAINYIKGLNIAGLEVGL